MKKLILSSIIAAALFSSQSFAFDKPAFSNLADDMISIIESQEITNASSADDGISHLNKMISIAVAACKDKVKTVKGDDKTILSTVISKANSIGKTDLAQFKKQWVEGGAFGDKKPSSEIEPYVNNVIYPAYSIAALNEFKKQSDFDVLWQINDHMQASLTSSNKSK